jgi:hypothetical protein
MIPALLTTEHMFSAPALRYAAGVQLPAVAENSQDRHAVFLAIRFLPLVQPLASARSTISSAKH